jgi:energy-coupling factor transporter ATP-binding protein EcfA2
VTLTAPLSLGLGAEATPVLELIDVVKQYPGDPPVVALAGVSLSVDAGELAAIVGPSGSGKSTVLHVMGTLERPTFGTVKVAGEDTSGPCPTGSCRVCGPGGWASCSSSSSSSTGCPCWTMWPTGSSIAAGGRLSGGSWPRPVNRTPRPIPRISFVMCSTGEDIIFDSGC